MPYPDVSVVIPTYNYARFLAHAIESILAQEGAEAEIIVVDDGSTDHTHEVARRFAGNIEYVSTPHRGPAFARNTGIELSKGELIAFLDADDYWLPGKLARQLSFLRAHPVVDLCHGAFLIASEGQETGRLRRYWQHSGFLPSLLELLRNCWVNTSTVIVRRSVFSQIGMFDTSFRTSEDWNMWLRIILSGRRIFYLYEPLALSRQHRDSTHVKTPPKIQLQRAEVMLRSVAAEYDGRIPTGFRETLPALLHFHLAKLCCERGELRDFIVALSRSMLANPRLSAEMVAGVLRRRLRDWLTQI